MHTRLQKLQDITQQVMIAAVKELPSKEELRSILIMLSERGFIAEERLNLLCFSVDDCSINVSCLVASYQDNELSKLFNFIILDINDQGITSDILFNRVLGPYSYFLLSNKPENEIGLGLDYLFMLKELASSKEEILAHLKSSYEYKPGYQWSLYDAILMEKTIELIYALIDLDVLEVSNYALLKDKKDEMFDLIQRASRCVDEARLREFRDELELIIKDETNAFHQFFSTKRGWSGHGTFKKLTSLLEEVIIRLEGFSASSSAPSMWGSVSGRAMRLFQPVPPLLNVNFSEDEDMSKSSCRLAFHEEL